MSTANSTSPKRQRRARLVGISVSGLAPALVAKLKRRAASEHRTVASTVRLILADAVERAEAAGQAAVAA